MNLKKQEQRYKEYLRLLEADKQNDLAQDALGYVELDRPRPNGWEVVFIPRSDIQNRDDADAYWKVIFLCMVKGRIRNKNQFKSKKRKYQDWPYHPKFKTILEDDYQKLTAHEKTLFCLATSSFFLKNGIDSRGRKHYKPCVPNFYWEEKLVRSYITKIKLIDVDLKREEAEIDGQLERYRYRYHFDDLYNGSVPKDYMKPYMRSYRRTCKAITKQIAKGMEKEIPPLKEMQGRASWDYW